MRSTFMGLETAKRGMFTQQGALYVTGNNISNANTPGYTRQRANFEQTESYPYTGMNRPGIPGQIGTGVTTGSIERIRDSFIDTQYRTQNNTLGYYSAKTDAYTKMEDIMNEPSNSGLQSTMDTFWSSLQTLSANNENKGARDVVAAAGQRVADTFNYYYNSLTRVQKDLGNQIAVKVDEINKTLSNISQLNKQISEVEPHGYLPNDLYDQRDSLVDKLSGMINIKVTPVVPDQYGNASPIANGIYKIELLNEDGSQKINLLDVDQKSGQQSGPKLLSIVPDTKENTSTPITSISVNGSEVNWPDMNVGGELAGLIHSYGYTDGNQAKGIYPDMISNINNMAKAFANEFNRIHSEGYALNESDEDRAKASDHNFFEIKDDNPAQSIKVKQSIIDHSDSIRAGKDNGNSGNNDNARLLADLKIKSFTQYGSADPAKGMTGNLDSFYAGIIGAMGVDSQTAQQNVKNTTIISASIDERRQSVSAVSLDEEMVNMIKFQHAYNASARNITMIDEMLDRIINGMGVVGR